MGEPHPADLIAFLPEAACADALAAGRQVSPDLHTVAGAGCVAVLDPSRSDGGGGPRAARLGRALVHRQRIYEAMLEAAPILPVLPGPDATEAMAPAVLCAHGRRISDAVDLIRGRRQYQITVRSARPNAWSDGGAKIAAAALTALDPVLDDSIRLPSDGPDLALNLVVLVPADAEAAMEAAINTFDRDVGGLKITLLGPLPPISFHAARIRALDAKVLARAARRLGVEAGSRLDIGVAFRRFAGARHPDRGGPDKIDFAELVAARDTMREADKLRAALRAAGCPEPDAGLPALDIVRDGGAGGVSQMADRPRAA